MKKSIVRILALSLVAVMMCLALVSCGGPSGEYGSDDYTLKFSGSKITVSWKGLTQSYELTGKFEMGKDDDGNKTITFTMDEVKGDSFLGDAAYAGTKALFDGTKSYNSGKDDNGNYIEIGGLRYYKK
ncbi:MAG: DUF945 domain-containing protein [Ruminococcaceae bacterium]|nr:DUF945 domain-containing protein [Oscillospiraceae bacterium]